MSKKMKKITTTYSPFSLKRDPFFLCILIVIKRSGGGLGG